MFITTTTKHTGRRAHLLALAATAALAIVLAGVATHMTKDNNSSSSSDAHASTCTPIQSTALDGFLAPLSGACAVIALLALFVYPVWRDRRGGQRRQQQQDRATLPSGALEPLLEGGGAGTDLPQPRQQGQQQQPQGAGLPSRRLKLLVAFSALTMLLGCGRCLLRLTRYVRVYGGLSVTTTTDSSHTNTHTGTSTTPSPTSPSSMPPWPPCWRPCSAASMRSSATCMCTMCCAGDSDGWVGGASVGVGVRSGERKRRHERLYVCDFFACTCAVINGRKTDLLLLALAFLHLLSFFRFFALTCFPFIGVSFTHATLHPPAPHPPTSLYTRHRHPWTTTMTTTPTQPLPLIIKPRRRRPPIVLPPLLLVPTPPALAPRLLAGPGAAAHGAELDERADDEDAEENVEHGVHFVGALRVFWVSYISW